MNAESQKPVFAGFLLWDMEGDRVLACSRKTNFEDWGLPSGKIEGREPPAPAALRELKEETGLVLPSHLFDMREDRQVTMYCEHAGGDGVFYFVPLGPSSLKAVNEKLPDLGRGMWQPPGEGMVTWKKPKELLKPTQTFREFNRTLFEHFDIIPSPAPPVTEHTMTVPPESVVAKSNDASALIRMTELLRREVRAIDGKRATGDMLFKRIPDREIDGFDIWESEQGWRVYDPVAGGFPTFEVNVDCSTQQALDLYERYLDMYESLFSR